MIKKLKIVLKLTLLFFVFVSLIGSTALAFQSPVGNNNEKVNVLIGFHQAPGPSEQALIRGFGGEIYNQFHIVNVLAARMAPQAVSALERNPRIEYIEIDGPVQAFGQTTPWGIDRVFGDESYSFDTWGITRGSEMAVAIIDTGIDEKHEDLPALLGGVNTIDDTHWGADGSGHGTHVAGTVAALDNEVGVVGVGPEVGLYAVKVLNDSGSGTISSVVGGIEWSVGQSIPVLNMSLGTGTHYQTLQDACDNAYSAGHLVVAAAGNSGNPLGRGDNVGYPAKYNSVVAVAASDSKDKRASFSSTGPAVELIAPGVSVLSTLPGHSYGTYSGTSMASPHVAGVAALAWSVNSTLSNSDIRGILQQTAEDLGLSANHQGYGLVRADLAVRAVVELEPAATGNIEGTVRDESGAVIEGAGVLVEGTSLSATTDTSGYYLLENVPTGDQKITASAEGYYPETATVTVAEDATVTLNFVLQAIPTYTVSGTVKDTEGNPLEGAAVAIEGTNQAATTDSDGAYSISDIEKGTYDITASKSGYSSQTKTVMVGNDTTVDFVLEEITEEQQLMNVDFIEMWYKAAGPNRFVYTTVKVISADNTSVSGATVYLTMTLPDNSQIFLSGNTADDGTITFEVKLRQTGTYTSTVTDVAKDGWIYDSSANKETSKSLNVIS